MTSIKGNIYETKHCKKVPRKMDIPNVSGPILGGNPDPIYTYKIHHVPTRINLGGYFTIKFIMREILNLKKLQIYSCLISIDF